MANPWVRIKQSPAVFSGTSVSVTFDQTIPLDNTHTLVAIVQASSGSAPATTSWPFTSGGNNGGACWVGIFVARGDGTLNGFTASYATSQTQFVVTLFAFAGHISTALSAGIGKNFASATTTTAGPTTVATTAPNTIAIAAVALSSGGGGTWGTFSDGFTSAPMSQSRLYVGAKAFTTAGQTPQASVSWTSARIGRDAMWVIEGVEPAANTAPTVSVPADLTVIAKQPVSLSATASDSDGTITGYSWSILSADTSPTLQNASTQTVSFTPTVASTVTLRCTVFDNNSGTASDDITVTVLPENDIKARLGTSVVKKRLLGTQEVLRRYKGSTMIWDKSLVAEWNFAETNAPFLSTRGGMPLAQGNVGVPVTKAASPWGSAVVFNGSSSYLKLAKEFQNILNLGKTTQKVTVAAWVYREETDTGFIAGAWQEDNSDPRRSYGLFVDLPTYGGTERSCFHVSKLGGATPGYPYSRDYSASGQTVTNSVWQLHVGTYDGAAARSYLNGAFAGIPTYTDNQGAVYSKNPYLFTEGLNAEPCDFTVGAVTLTAGLGNFFAGRVAKLRVWDRALTAAEIQALYTTESTVL